MDITIMFYCEQVADIAIDFIRGSDLLDVFLNRYELITAEQVNEIHQSFLETTKSPSEFVNEVYDACISHKIGERL